MWFNSQELRIFQATKWWHPLAIKHSAQKLNIDYCCHIHIWLVVDLPLWKMMEFVSWDYDIPNIWKNKNVPNHILIHIYLPDKIDIYIYIYWRGPPQKGKKGKLGDLLSDPLLQDQDAIPVWFWWCLWWFIFCDVAQTVKNQIFIYRLY